jgi:hypothetical protein
MRGNRSGNALLTSQMVLVYKHIFSFPVKENHCPGTDFKYLKSKLTVKKIV